MSTKDNVLEFALVALGPIGFIIFLHGEYHNAKWLRDIEDSTVAMKKQTPEERRKATGGMATIWTIFCLMFLVTSGFAPDAAPDAAPISVPDPLLVDFENYCQDGGVDIKRVDSEYKTLKVSYVSTSLSDEYALIAAYVDLIDAGGKYKRMEAEPTYADTGNTGDIWIITTEDVEWFKRGYMETEDLYFRSLTRHK